ncbi:nitronate monooxygenase [Saccharopolyspora spinosa]|uniref:nitronate monooxygenase n=1 Tax=Saccharopolyspora spinosa TaxID=60894 RepID=UPI000237B383|nr:nitronate monooxygenase [Saccharopolyspora spinosa]
MWPGLRQSWCAFGGRPYGVDVPVRSKTATGDPADYLASLRAQIPQAHYDFVNDLLAKYDTPPVDTASAGDRFAASVGPETVQPLAGRRHLLAPDFAGRKRAGHTAADDARARQGRRGADRGADRLAEARSAPAGDVRRPAGRARDRGRWAHRNHRDLVLVPEVVDLVRDVPVPAAGGIATRRQVAAPLALGAAGDVVANRCGCPATRTSPSRR